MSSQHTEKEPRIRSTLDEQIRAHIGVDVLDHMLDDLAEGLVAMARAEAERSAGVRAGTDCAKQRRSAREELCQ